jgi:hypothetical protein
MVIRRTSRLTLLLSEQELEQLQAIAAAKGFGHSVYARSIVLDSLPPTAQAQTGSQDNINIWRIPRVYWLAKSLTAKSTTMVALKRIYTTKQIDAVRPFLNHPVMLYRMEILEDRWGRTLPSGEPDISFDFDPDEELPYPFDYEQRDCE